MPLISPDSADSRAMTTTGCQPPPSAYCPASSPTQPNPAAAAIRRSLSRSGPACGASVAAREPVVPKTPAPSACASSRPPPTSSAAASGIGMVTAKRTTSGHGTGGRLVRTSSSSQAGARSPLSATREACHPVAAERRTPVAHWSRAVVLLRPVTAIAERTAGHRIGAAAAPPPGGWLRRLSGYCLRHRADLYGAFAAALIGSVIAAVVPLLTRAVVDRVVAGSGSGTAVDVTPFVAALVAAGALRFGAGFVRRYLAGRLSLDVQMDLRNDVQAALSRLDGPGQDRLRTGQAGSRSISDVTLVQGLLAFLPNLTGNALLFVVSLAVMAWLSPLLTVVAIAVGPALWWLGLRSRRDLFPANWVAQQQAGVLAGEVEAAVTGVRVVKGFGQEGRELDRVDRGARVLYGMRMRVVRFTARYNPLLQAVPALGQVGVLALGGWLALEGSISLGTFLAFASYLAALVSPVRQLAAVLTVGQQARAGVERVLEVVDQRPGIVGGDAVLPGGPLTVELDEVTFAHKPGRPVLDDVSLKVEPGETLALVGAAGSGKSSVVSLLPRFYDVSAGAVRIGGVDVRELELGSLRGALGVVPEDSFLFSDSVRANIAFGRPDATDEQVR